MTHQGFKTIQERGGLKVHLTSLGISYDYFSKLADLGLDNTAIAKLLNSKYPNRDKPIHRVSVGSWKKHRQEEKAKLAD